MAAHPNGVHEDGERDSLPTPPSPTASTSSLPSDFGSITSADGRGDFRAPLSDSFSDVSIDGESVLRLVVLRTALRWRSACSQYPVVHD